MLFYEFVQTFPRVIPACGIFFMSYLDALGYCFVPHRTRPLTGGLNSRRHLKKINQQLRFIVFNGVHSF